MKIIVLAVVTLSLSVISCKEKKEEKEDGAGFISVKSLIEAQVAHVDTSLYAIRKVILTDSAHSDTTFIPREEFREAAKDFLSIPDLADPKIARRYTQESRYDTLLKKVMFTYTPVDPKSEEVKKQEILVATEVDDKGNNKISSIIIERSVSDRNGFFGQKMLWTTDKYFMIITTTEKPGATEVVTIMKVIWNEE